MKIRLKLLKKKKKINPLFIIIKNDKYKEI